MGKHLKDFFAHETRNKRHLNMKKSKNRRVKKIEVPNFSNGENPFFRQQEWFCQLKNKFWRGREPLPHRHVFGWLFNFPVYTKMGITKLKENTKFLALSFCLRIKIKGNIDSKTFFFFVLNAHTYKQVFKVKTFLVLRFSFYFGWSVKFCSLINWILNPNAGRLFLFIPFIFSQSEVKSTFDVQTIYLLRIITSNGKYISGVVVM